MPIAFLVWPSCVKGTLYASGIYTEFISIINFPLVVLRTQKTKQVVIYFFFLKSECWKEPWSHSEVVNIVVKVKGCLCFCITCMYLYLICHIVCTDKHRPTRVHISVYLWSDVTPGASALFLFKEQWVWKLLWCRLWLQVSSEFELECNHIKADSNQSYHPLWSQPIADVELVGVFPLRSFLLAVEC